jgi:anti-anti-sigma factor
MPRVTGTSTGDFLTLAVAGSLRGDAAARQVEAAAARLVRSRHREVRVSLADVPALDAAGIGRLVILARALAARGLRMRLVDVPPRLGRILEAVHLRHLLCGREEAERISQSREEAATPAASSTVGAWV